MLKKRNLIFIALAFFLTMCSLKKNQEGAFVSTKNDRDTLILYENGSYTRIVTNESLTTKDLGTWYYADKRIWFNDWVNRGETDNTFNEGKKQSVAFSFEKSFLGKIKEIYFDVDDYYYFRRIK
jgi:hypothetical protein